MTQRKTFSSLLNSCLIASLAHLFILSVFTSLFVLSLRGIEQQFAKINISTETVYLVRIFCCHLPKSGTQYKPSIIILSFYFIIVYSVITSGKK